VFFSKNAISVFAVKSIFLPMLFQQKRHKRFCGKKHIFANAFLVKSAICAFNGKKHL